MNDRKFFSYDGTKLMREPLRMAVPAAKARQKPAGVRVIFSQPKQGELISVTKNDRQISSYHLI